MATVTMNDANFERMLNRTEPVLVDFWAEWCGPCKMMAPVLEDLSLDMSGKLVVAKLDVDQNPNTAAKYGIMSIPTMIVFQGGRPVKKLVGYMSKADLKNRLADIL